MQSIARSWLNWQVIYGGSVGRIYQTSLMGEADVRVAIVDNRGQADLLVHKVGSWALAHGDARWYLTRDKQEATVWICVCSQGMADVFIHFVKTYGEAGWQNTHKFRGRFR